MPHNTRNTRDSRKKTGEEKNKMNFKAHIIGGLIAYFIITRFFNKPIFDILGLVLAITFALIPDIDHPESHIRKIILLLLLFTGCLMFVMNYDTELYFIFGIILAILLSKHRGFWHKGMFIIIMITSILTMPTYYAIIIILVYLSHLIIDAA